jgi:hypothetical protein
VNLRVVRSIRASTDRVLVESRDGTDDPAQRSS